MKTDSNSQTVLDPQSITLGKTYAQALLELANSREHALALSDQLEKISDILKNQPGFYDLISTGALNKQQRVALVEKVFAGKVFSELENFIGVLAVNNRLGIIKNVSQCLKTLVQNQAGEILVHVTTACKISEDQLAALTKVLEKILKAKPLLNIKIDPDIIGGIKLRINDSTYDASVAGELERLTQKMSHRNLFKNNFTESAGKK